MLLFWIEFEKIYPHILHHQPRICRKENLHVGRKNIKFLQNLGILGLLGYFLD